MKHYIERLTNYLVDHIEELTIATLIAGAATAATIIYENREHVSQSPYYVDETPIEISWQKGDLPLRNP